MTCCVSNQSKTVAVVIGDKESRQPHLDIEIVWSRWMEEIGYGWQKWVMTEIYHVVCVRILFVSLEHDLEYARMIWNDL